jgi:hypothetical protein
VISAPEDIAVEARMSARFRLIGMLGRLLLAWSFASDA